MRVGLILAEVGSGLRRNLSMVVSVVLVTFISLTFVGVAALLQIQISAMKSYWYDRAQVAVYLCSDYDQVGNCSAAAATPEQVAAVLAQLDSAPLGDYVEEAAHSSREAIYSAYIEQFGDQPEAAFVTPDMLNEVIRITLNDPSDADVIIESLTTASGVQSVEDQRSYLEPIFAMLNAASLAAIGIAVLMLVAAVLLIGTTIRLSAFSRRRELGIMRLVGASNRFIETPFVLEGIVASLVGSLLASGALFAIVQFFLKGTLSESLGGSGLMVGLRDAALIAPALVLVGVALAGISASVAIRRYLKV